MGVLISTNGVLHKETVVGGFVAKFPEGPEELRKLVSESDWSPIIFRDGIRKGENFIEALTLAIDVDNTGLDQMSIFEFSLAFAGVEHYIMTSKSHQKPKMSKKVLCPPADRYHVCFPLAEAITSPADYRGRIEVLIQQFPAIDAGAKDGARFFYGYEETQVFYNPGKPLTIVPRQQPVLPEAKPLPAPVQPAPTSIASMVSPDQASTKPKSRLHAMEKVEYYEDDDQLNAKIFEVLQEASKAGAFDEREAWIDCGMACKAAGFSFEQWMSLSWESEPSADNRSRWNGFRADRHTRGTLIHYARQFSPGFLTKRTALSAYSPETFVMSEAKASLRLAMPHTSWYQPHLITTRKKNAETGQMYETHKPLATLANLEAMLAFYGISVRENLMKHEVETVIPGVDKAEGKHENASFADLLSICVINGFPTEKLKEYIIKIAHQNSYHPVKDWLEVLPAWDKVDRIEQLLDEVIVLDKTKTSRDLAMLFLRKFFIACVASVLEPRFRSRGVLTFQGKQEIGKTAFFRSIMPKEHYADWFKDGLHVDPKDRDSVHRACSRWMVELGEIEGLFQKEQSALKAFLTSDEDVLRLPYEPKAESYQRRTNFCASANDGAFLNDPTGSSRFWVLAVLSVDYQHSMDVAGLWSQALEYYRSGEEWWLKDGEREALSLNNSQFQEVDAYQELIKIHFDFETLALGGKTVLMSATEVARQCECKMNGHKDSRGIAKALRSMGIEIGYMANRSMGFHMPVKQSSTYNPAHNYSERSF